MLAWAWRIASRRGVGSMAARLAAMVAALPVLAAVLAGVPTPPVFGMAHRGGAGRRGRPPAGICRPCGGLRPAGAGRRADGLDDGLGTRRGADGAGAGPVRRRMACRWSPRRPCRALWRFAAGAAPPACWDGCSQGSWFGCLDCRGRCAAATVAGGGSIVRRPPLPVRNWCRRRMTPPPAMIIAHRARRDHATAQAAPGEPAAGEAGWRFPSLSLLKPAPARATTGPERRRRCRRTRGCWKPCCPTTACRAASSRSGPARW